MGSRVAGGGPLVGTVEHVADDEADTVAVPNQKMREMVFGSDDTNPSTESEAA